MKVTLKLADIVISVDVLFPSSALFLRDYSGEGEPDFSVGITEEDIEYERKATEVYRYAKLSPEYLERQAIFRKIAERLHDFNAFLIHASAVAVDGKAFLFTAKSGTGKSTHAALWRQYLGDKVVMINDDKPILKVTPNGVFVYGTPWTGKHGIGENVAFPLKAIGVLKRAESNEVVSLGFPEAYPYLLGEVYRPLGKAALIKTLGLIDGLSEKAGFYLIGCNTSPAAAETAYLAMKEENV